MRLAVSIPADAPLAAGAKLALGVEIAATYARVRWELRRVGLREALARLRAGSGGGPTGAGVATGRRLGRVVTRTLTLLPSDSRCLMRSLVLTRLLARRGIETRLVIAVRPGERFAAHAWIEHDGAPLLPAEAPSFEQLVTL
jgi:hypothetical protein